MRKLFWITISAFLVACGGGGGGSTAPVAAATEFQFKTALVNSIKNSKSLPFTVSGTVNKVAVTGSGTVTQGTPTPATFETVVGFKTVSTTTGNLTVNGQTVPLSSVGTTYVDSNYFPIGDSSGTEYSVVIGTPIVPTIAKINDTGELYTAKRYRDSTKAVLIGTETATYVLQPDTSTTALVKIIHVYKDTTGSVTLTSTTTLRATTDGTITYISSTGLYDNGDTVTLNF